MSRRRRGRLANGDELLPGDPRAVDGEQGGAVGLVHAMLLRIQALMLPIKLLVFGGH